MKLRINEIFHSIQGESTFAGQPFVFVRLTGCNLRCRYCDTRYAYDEGRPCSIEGVLQRVAAFSCPRVTLTGGEPLLQPETPALATTLLDRGFQVTVETNGSLDIGRLDRRCIKVMDIKCPSSGMARHNRWDNLPLLSPRDEVKFVIADRTDYDFAHDTLSRLPDWIPPGQRLYSPVHGILDARQLAEWILADGAGVRLQLQLHKLLWPDTERGV